MLKSVVVKTCKNQEADFETGSPFIDEEFLIPVQGRVEKLNDETAVPTVPISRYCGSQLS